VIDRELSLMAALYAAAFVIGSIPFGLIVAKIFGIENLRKQGSGNIGATNVTRVGGFWPAGFLTLFFDTLKGAATITLVASPYLASWVPEIHDLSVASVWTTGFFTVFGHCYSPWLKFKGGKGVATGLGVIAVLTPYAALIGVLVFIYAFLLVRVGSLASISGLVAASVAHLVFYPIEPYLWVAGLMVLVILFRHESNLDALLEGREKSFHATAR
jgi:glycerol-3-phosphate acyltransferase PlsY